MIAIRCALCLIARIITICIIGGAGIWLLTNAHETAGGWTLAAAILWALCAKCGPLCLTTEEAARWAEIEEREKEQEHRHTMEQERAR